RSSLRLPYTTLFRTRSAERQAGNQARPPPAGAIVALCSARSTAGRPDGSPPSVVAGSRSPGGCVLTASDVLTVHGGTPLAGEVRVRGAKNLVSKAMVAALLGDEPS